jgi:WD40 repeat protein
MSGLRDRRVGRELEHYAPQYPSSFSPDGKHLVFSTPLTSPRNLGVLSLDDHKEALLLDTSFSEMNGELSPDGRWLAYQSDESGSVDSYLVPFPDVQASKRKVSTGGGTRPLWRQDGHELFYYVNSGTIMAVHDYAWSGPDVRPSGRCGQRAVRIADKRWPPLRCVPGRKRFLLLKDVGTSGSNKPPPPEIRLVQHWVNERAPRPRKVGRAPARPPPHCCCHRACRSNG